MKLILITGIPRSGSTWQYNVVRLALEQSGHSVYGAWIGDYNTKTKADYHIVKIHGFDNELRKRAFKIFTTVREFEGIKTSLQRMGWYKSDKGIMKYITEWCLWWQHCSHITNFRDIIWDELCEIHDIIDHLDIDVSGRKVQGKLYKLKLPKKGEYAKTGSYHTTTLLHPHHYE